MSSPPKLAVTLVGAVLLIGITGCQARAPDPEGSNVTTQSAQMPPLPKDRDAAKAVVRKMLMDEAIVLLKATGLKYTSAQFDVPISYDDGDTQNGDLLIEFTKCTDADVQSLTAAVFAHGWKQAGGISHGVNVVKGPLRLGAGKNPDGCDFRMTTVDISQRLRITDDITSVPELAAFKARP
jgi:hypothetical protein